MSKNAVLQRVEVNEGETLNSAMDRLGLVLEDSHYYEHMKNSANFEDADVVFRRGALISNGAKINTTDSDYDLFRRKPFSPQNPPFGPQSVLVRAKEATNGERSDLNTKKRKLASQAIEDEASKKRSAEVVPTSSSDGGLPAELIVVVLSLGGDNLLLWYATMCVSKAWRQATETWLDTKARSLLGLDGPAKNIKAVNDVLSPHVPRLRSLLTFPRLLKLSEIRLSEVNASTGFVNPNERSRISEVASEYAAMSDAATCALCTKVLSTAISFFSVSDDPLGGNPFANCSIAYVKGFKQNLAMMDGSDFCKRFENAFVHFLMYNRVRGSAPVEFQVVSMFETDHGVSDAGMKSRVDIRLPGSETWETLVVRPADESTAGTWVDKTRIDTKALQRIEEKVEQLEKGQDDAAVWTSSLLDKISSILELPSVIWLWENALTNLVSHLFYSQDTVTLGLSDHLSETPRPIATKREFVERVSDDLEHSDAAGSLIQEMYGQSLAIHEIGVLQKLDTLARCIARRACQAELLMASLEKVKSGAPGVVTPEKVWSLLRFHNNTVSNRSHCNSVAHSLLNQNRWGFAFTGTVYVLSDDVSHTPFTINMHCELKMDEYPDPESIVTFDFGGCKELADAGTDLFEGEELVTLFPMPKNNRDLEFAGYKSLDVHDMSRWIIDHVGLWVYVTQSNDDGISIGAFNEEFKEFELQEFHDRLNEVYGRNKAMVEFALSRDCARWAKFIV